MKACRKCGRELPLSGFYNDRRRPDGHKGTCKDCWKKDKLQYDYVHRAERNASNKRSHGTREWRIKHNERRRQQRERHPEYAGVQIRVYRAIRDGVIVKPDTCAICGAGGALLAHHHDYDRPLDVDFLCPLCHSAIHYAASEFAERVVVAMRP